ncbi:MAG: DNA recombination/repair protein RecA, partial [Cytophagaceae bacterium]
ELLLDNPELMGEIEGKIRAKIATDDEILLDPVLAATAEDDEGEIDD